jgi:MFS family permease
VQVGRATKIRSIAVLAFTQIMAMSLWFISAAVLPEMVAESQISAGRQALLSSAVQAGFVVGALISAALGLADRFDPRRVVMISAILAALANASLLIAPIGGIAAITARFLTGALLAGVYPVGMKIAAGWGKTDRGLLIGLLVGALTLGSASPYLASLLGGADWRIAVTITSLAAALGGLSILLAGLGPYHAKAARFDPGCIRTAWTNRRIRLAYAGYFGHQWEIYAMWAWIGVVAAASYSASLPAAEATELAKLTAFLAIGLGGVACMVAGAFADKFGKAETTIIAMGVSGTCAVATALSFEGPVWITFALILLWGISIVPDSAQFSASVADQAPPENAGSLLTLQTALGFALTIPTVQLTPLLAEAIGWPGVLVVMALGPLFGVIAMERLRRLLIRERARG